MKNYQFIMITYILARVQDSETVTLSNKQVNMALHDYTYSWNDAQTICETNGGKLFVEDSAERSIVLSNFRSNWNSNDEYWTGLHYPAVGVNDVYGWTNCFWLSFYDNWESVSEPKNTNDHRCVKSTTNGWKTNRCNQKKRFVCETSLGDCTFSERTGFPNPTADFSSLSITTVNQSVCEERCLNKLHMNKNCWGANFNSSSSSQNCILYFTADPFYFNTSATYDTSIVTMSIKDCYIDELRTDDIFSDIDDNTMPANVCSSYTEEMTTSTTTTTTTISTTMSTTSTTTTTSRTTTTTASATTTATPTTTISLPPTTTTSTCQCNCANISNVLGNYMSDWANMTLEEKVEDLVTRLRVDKTNLSSFVRKKTSATDERIVSKSLGYLGMFLLSLIFVLLIVSDGINFLAYLKREKD